MFIFLQMFAFRLDTLLGYVAVCIASYCIHWDLQLVPTFYLIL
jgi:hypothetical protein